ncbi:S-adenosylmethionine transporter [Diatrype stigma]|uniref:S-adenosylmethionine transporter n=1 Tax=Diatrype stigma TaxID=117547 RepID=A0AAN9UMZ5_9PEZI
MAPQKQAPQPQPPSAPATAAAPPPSFRTALLAGGIAGTTVDLSLFPLDTLKTRLQSRAGFFGSGGFRGVYRGVGSAVVGSAPGAAFFFCTYEGAKSFLQNPNSPVGNKNASAWTEPLTHMLAASLGEVAACAVRVPTEVVKQRAQAGQHGGSSWGALRAILAQKPPPSSSSSSSSGIGRLGVVWRELYRGWGITVMREVPFTVIQFPLWEALKGWGRERRRRRRLALPHEMNNSNSDNSSAARRIPGASDKEQEQDVSAAESALYGSVSGAVAAAVTTPLDVLKTRVMLSRERARVLPVLREIWAAHGVRPFFAGIGPRVAWISAGGAIFLGSYQWAVNTLQGQHVL